MNRTRRNIPDDPRLPQLDDDLATLVAKSKAIFSSRSNAAMPPAMAQMRRQEVPAPRQQEARRPSGLMKRPEKS